MTAITRGSCEHVELGASHSGRCKACYDILYYAANKGRKNAQSRAYYATHREQCRAWGRDWQLRTKYGIGATDVDRMIDEQGGGCALCGGSLSTRPCVDHSHKTGEIRGVLCIQCNTGLSCQEQAGWPERAHRYLAAHR